MLIRVIVAAVMLFAFGCDRASVESLAGDAPKADAPKADAPKADAPKPDAPKPDAPKSDAPKPEVPDAPVDDGAKPGEHGCGSCVVRACLAGGAISNLRLDLKLETELKSPRYDKAMLRLSPASGGGQTIALDAGKLVPNAPYRQILSASSLSQLKSPEDWKGATGQLMLYWNGPDGRRGQQLPIAVRAGACP